MYRINQRFPRIHGLLLGAVVLGLPGCWISQVAYENALCKLDEDGDGDPRCGLSNTVQDGDYLITIAEDWFGESGRHDEIIALNPGVNPTKLQIGQILKMPRKSQPRTKPVDPTLAANEYRIAPNDNYTRIARLLLGDEARASEIAALNPDLDPGNLQVGTIIKLPPKRVRKPEDRPVKRPPLRTGEQYYTVKSGDSLARIVGDLWGVQREDWVDLLYQRNKDTIGEDRTKLNLEQILIIPVKPKS